MDEAMRINLKLEDPELTSYMEKYPQKLRAEITRKLMYIAILLESQGLVSISNLSLRENDTPIMNTEVEKEEGEEKYEAEPEKDLGELLGIEYLSF